MDGPIDVRTVLLTLTGLLTSRVMFGVMFLLGQYGPDRHAPFAFRWDRLLLISTEVAFLAWVPLAALACVPFQWYRLCTYLQIVGMLEMCSWMAIMLSEAMHRPHRQFSGVISGGAYRFVRHPMYATTLFFLVSMAGLLGDSPELQPAIYLSVGIVLLTWLEDRILGREMAGYKDYAQKVRYRLVPYLW